MNDFHHQLVLPALPWLTENQRLSWWTRARLVKDWRHLAYWSAAARHVPTLERALVVVELRFATRRVRDPGNWAPTAKAIVDGLVDAGVFVNDNTDHVIGPDLREGPPTKVRTGLAVVHLLPPDGRWPE